MVLGVAALGVEVDVPAGLASGLDAGARALAALFVAVQAGVDVDEGVADASLVRVEVSPLGEVGVDGEAAAVGLDEVRAGRLHELRRVVVGPPEPHDAGRVTNGEVDHALEDHLSPAPPRPPQTSSPGGLIWTISKRSGDGQK